MFRVLEVDLTRELQDARSEGRSDAAKSVVVDVLNLADVEVRVVEDVERLEPKLEVDALGDAGTFDQAQVEIEPAGAADGRQLQRPQRARSRIAEDLRVGSAIGTDQARIKHDDAALSVSEQSGLALQVADRKRAVDRVLGRTPGAVERAARRDNRNRLAGLPADDRVQTPPADDLARHIFVPVGTVPPTSSIY